MPDLQPPTGEEVVRKHYSGPYLDEVDEFKAQVASAAATGTDINTEGIHPTVIAAVAPQLLTDEQRAEVDEVTPEAHKPGEIGYAEQSHVEAQGDEDERIKLGQEVQERDRKADEERKRNEDSDSDSSDSGNSLLSEDATEPQVGDSSTDWTVTKEESGPEDKNEPELAEATDSQVDNDNQVNPHEAISNPSTRIVDDREAGGDPTPLDERGKGLEDKQGETGVPSFNFDKNDDNK